MPTNRPAKAEGLDVNVVQDGYVIYQPDTDRVHYLNVTSAVIFELCNGRRDLAAVAEGVARQFEMSDAPLDAVAEIVAKLTDEGVFV